MPKRDRPIELLLWGATGFTGRLAAEWLAAHYAGDRIALGGRSTQKLEKLRDELVVVDKRCAKWAIRTADSLDVPALDRIVPDAAVIATTAGPFSLYGHELAAACARHGTDYCDITGEVPFARQMLDRNEIRAKESGARLVPFCGFDSIPSDLGVFVLQEFCKRELGEACAEATFILVKARGGVSGGTAASMIAIMEQAEKDPKVRSMLADPYALAPGDHDGATDAHGAKNTDDGWTAPFAMGTINSRVVHRSNLLLDHAYGRGFRYEERVVLGEGARGFARATAMSAGLAMGERVLTVGPARNFMKRWLPTPGEGPSKERRDGGSFHVRVIGRNSRDEIVATCNVTGKGDPGYSGAAKMLVESALCLSRDVDGPGGVPTPASCMGDALVKRLRTAGIAFDVSR